MDPSFLSPTWYRVADLQPRLKSHAQIHRMKYRGQTWHVLQDHQSGQFFRVSPAANLMICLMDGRRSVNWLWLHACETYPDDPPTQDETIRLLALLHQADLMHTDLDPDLGELERRSQRNETRAIMSRLRNPLALRFPLFDPDKFLDATFPLLRWLFTPFGMLLWLCLVGSGATLAVMNADVLTADLADRILATQNLLLLALTYPAVKAVHELGHGYATKAAGGEVHEMGIMFLVLMPIPYVDASAASAFASKWQRMLVGSAGILVELALASGAMIFWLYAEPGIARAVAFNVMLIGGVSTLLFNGNPLLRFDGYYVFSDLLEIPNLGPRSNKYLGYLVQSRLFGLRSAQTPVTQRGERGWFAFYAIASFVYRIGITITIALFIASKFFIVGILLALMALANMFVWPVLKGLKFVLTNKALKERRGRAIAWTVVLAALPIGFVTAVPLPYATVVQGVVLPPQVAVVRTEAEGFLTAIAEDRDLRATQPLVALSDPMLGTQEAILTAQLDEMRQRLGAAVVLDQVAAQALRAQIAHLEGALALERRRVATLDVVAPRDGVFLTNIADRHIGRLVPKGSEVGYLVQPGELVVRAVVPQTRIDLVRQRPGAVALRYGSAPAALHHARPLREATESRELPHPALSAAGGGTLQIDPTDPDRRRLLLPAFQIDLAVIDPPKGQRIGETVWVRFDHGTEPLARRFYRAVRQVFLSQFDV
ncbi:peptidase M50 [Thetidibacter halocola]|uniref:Peptidase M50 n=1 Tax=Thetidibacter halocola TaxID=2827239 RepID=A0A8J8B9S4_9RHOB|nr:peptidase M50 [Thetidibacter halocola]MBS0126827.1 peptidase M50 [Thetidibacter halocola]